MANNTKVCRSLSLGLLLLLLCVVADADEMWRLSSFPAQQITETNNSFNLEIVHQQQLLSSSSSSTCVKKRTLVTLQLEHATAIEIQHVLKVIISSLQNNFVILKPVIQNNVSLLWQGEFEDGNVSLHKTIHLHIEPLDTTTTSNWNDLSLQNNTATLIVKTVCAPSTLATSPTSVSSSLSNPYEEHHARYRRTLCSGLATIPATTLLNIYAFATNSGSDTYYANGMNCQWAFSSFPGTYIIFSLGSFNTEPTYDKATFYQSNGGTLIAGPLTGTSYTSYNSTSASSMYITFTSDGTVVSTGITATLYFIASNVFTTFTTNGQRFGSNTNGVNYVINMVTSWQLSATALYGYRASISVDTSGFSTEPNYDYLTMYDGTNTATQLSRTSGTTSPGVVIASGGYMYVTFTSDYSNTFNGFRATFIYYPATCATYTFSTGVSSGASLTGVTTNATTTTCASGYSIGGGSSITTSQVYTCSGTAVATSAWSPAPSSTYCQPVNCPSYPFTAGTTSSGGTLTGVTLNTVTATCASGYSIGGGASITASQVYTCTASAPAASVWSPVPSTTYCQPVNCASFTHATGTTTSGGTLTGVTGNTVTTTCANGYSIGGGASSTASRVYTCTASAVAASVWSPTPTSTACQPTNCPAFTFATGTTATGGSLSGVTGNTVTTTCANGYSIGGGSSAIASQVYTCTGTAPATTAWSPSPSAAASSCQPVNCPTYTFAAGTTSIGGTLTGVTLNSATTTCANGYSIGGGSSATATQSYTCTANGVTSSAWSPAPSSTYCQPAACSSYTFSAASIASGGTLTGTTGNTITTTCAIGYSIGGGSSTITSQVFTCSGTTPGNNAWSPAPSAAASSCQPVSCQTYNFGAGSTTVGSTLTGVTLNTVTASCASGYSIGGGSSTTSSQVYTCTATGAATSVWYPVPSTTYCQVVSCASYTFTAGATASGGTLTGVTGGSVTTSCSSGYSIGGGSSTIASQVYTCSASAPGSSVWSPSPSAPSTSCQPVSCSTYTFGAGSATTGSSLTGVTGNTVTTTCASGYSIGGGASTTASQVYTCTANGVVSSAWSPAPSTTYCQPVNCPTYSFDAGTTSAVGTLTGVTLNSRTTTCANGYSIGGGTSTTASQSYTCSASGVTTSAWSPAPVSTYCQVVNCSSYQFAAGKTISGSTLIGLTFDTITTTCADGYSIGGGSSTVASQVYTCTGSNPAVSSWLPNPAATASSCQPVACPSYTFGTGTTNAGTTLTGVTLDTITTTCANGFAIGGGSNTVTSQVYTCTATDSVTSQWSPQPDSTYCQPVNCPSYSFPSDIVSSGGSLSGVTLDTLTTTCANGYSVGGGSSSIASQTYTCSGSGSATSAWSPVPSAGVCAHVNCPTFSFTSGTTVSGSTLSGATTATITTTCANGHTIGGSSGMTSQVYTCTATDPARSAWLPAPSDSATSCQPVECPSIDFGDSISDANSSIYGRTNDIATIHCSDGYSIGGVLGGARSQSFSCVFSTPLMSVWSPALTDSNTCKPLQCTPFTFNSQTVVSGNNLVGATGTQITATCAVGYAVNGSESQVYTCTGISPINSVWMPSTTNTDSTCQPAHCPDFTFSTAAVVSGGVLTGVTGDQVTTTCKNGYAIGGAGSSLTKVYTCTGVSSGVSNWSPSPSSAVSSCQPIPCENVTLSSQATATGAIVFGRTNEVANIACAAGYAIGGGASNNTQQQFTCVATGATTNQWQPSPHVTTNICQPSNCDTFTFVRDVQSGTVLSGSTTTAITTICATGYAIGGVGNATSQVYTCSGVTPGHSEWSPSPFNFQTTCQAVCGDGMVVSPEQCDDGNTNNNDGCSSTCVVERGYICPTPGTACLHCLMGQRPTNIAPSCVNYGSALTTWVNSEGGATAPNYPACGSVAWNAPELINTTNTPVYCQVSTYRFGVTFLDIQNATDESLVTFTTVDNQAPSFQGVPSSVTVQCNAVPDVPVVTSSDPCDPSPSLVFTTSTIRGSCADSYQLKRTWNTTDSCGNSRAATQTITVQDTANPTLVNFITAPATVMCENVWRYNLSAVSVEDQCDLNPTFTSTQSRVNGSCPFRYQATQVFTGTDRCGNAVQQTRRFSVVDSSNPVISNMPANATVQCSAIPPASTSVVVSNNCDPTPQLSMQESRTNSRCPSTYTLVREWRGADSCGNTVSASQYISVVDNTPPTVTLMGLNPMTVQGGYAWLDPGVVATDDCNGDVSSSAVIVNAPITSAQRTVLGTYEVQYTVSDPCGNTASVNRTVIVVDTLPPYFTTSPALRMIRKSENTTLPMASAYDMVDHNLTADMIQPMFDPVRVGQAATPGNLLSLAYSARDLSNNQINSTGLLVKVLGPLNSSDTQNSVTVSVSFVPTILALPSAGLVSTVGTDTIPTATTITLTYVQSKTEADVSTSFEFLLQIIPTSVDCITITYNGFGGSTSHTQCDVVVGELVSKEQLSPLFDDPLLVYSSVPVVVSGVQGTNTYSPSLNSNAATIGVNLKNQLQRVGINTLTALKWDVASSTFVYSTSETHSRTSLDGWSGGMQFTTTFQTTPQPLWQYSVCKATVGGDSTTCETNDLSTDVVFAKGLAKIFWCRSIDDIQCLGDGCAMLTVWSALPPSTFTHFNYASQSVGLFIYPLDPNTFAVPRSPPSNGNTVLSPPPLSMLTFNVTNPNGWSSGVTCAAVLVRNGVPTVSTTIATSDSTICIVTASRLTAVQLQTLQQGLGTMISGATVSSNITPSSGSTSSLSSWIVVNLHLGTGRTITDLQTLLTLIGLTPISVDGIYCDVNSACTFVVASLANSQRASISQRYPDATFTSKTMATELLNSVLTQFSERFGVPLSLLSASAGNPPPSRRRGGGSGDSSNTVNIVINPGNNIGGSFKVACTSNGAVTDVNSFLSNLGWSVDQASMVNATVNAVVSTSSGSASTLQADLPHLCDTNYSIFIEPQGASPSASEWAGLLNELASAGAFTFAGNGVLFTPASMGYAVSLYSPVPTTAAPSSNSGASSAGGGGGLGMAAAGAGAGVAILVVIIVIIVVRRRRNTNNNVGKANMLTRRDSRLGGRGSINTAGFINPMYDEMGTGEEAHANARINGIEESDEALYTDHPKFGIPNEMKVNPCFDDDFEEHAQTFDDGGYLDMEPTAPSKPMLDEQPTYQQADDKQPYDNVDDTTYSAPNSDTTYSKATYEPTYSSSTNHAYSTLNHENYEETPTTSAASYAKSDKEGLYGDLAIPTTTNSEGTTATATTTNTHDYATATPGDDKINDTYGTAATYSQGATYDEAKATTDPTYGTSASAAAALASYKPGDEYDMEEEGETYPTSASAVSAAAALASYKPGDAYDMEEEGETYPASASAALASYKPGDEYDMEEEGETYPASATVGGDTYDMNEDGAPTTDAIAAPIAPTTAAADTEYNMEEYDQEAEDKHNTAPSLQKAAALNDYEYLESE